MKKTNKFYLLPTEKSHWYYIQNEDFPKGVEMPSATNILDIFPNPGLDYWRENTDPDIIKKAQEDGKNQGTKAHHCCYLLSAGQIINPNIGLTKNQVRMLPLETDEDKKKDDPLLRYLMQPLTKRENRCLEGFQNYWDEFKPISRGRELKVYHKKLRYAGTLDWIGYLWNKKEKKYELWLIDYKISNNHSRGYEAQLECYRKALNSMYRYHIKIRVGILYIGKTTKKKFQLKEMIDRKRAWDDFIISKKLWHSFNQNAQPTLIKELDDVSVDTSFKRKGRMFTINNKH